MSCSGQVHARRPSLCCSRLLEVHMAKASAPRGRASGHESVRERARGAETGRPRKRGKFVSRRSYLTTCSSLLDANLLDSCLRYFSPQVWASTSACTSAPFWRAVHGRSVPLLERALRCADVHPFAFLRPETFRALQRRLRTLRHTAALRRRSLALLGPAHPPFDGLVMC